MAAVVAGAALAAGLGWGASAVLFGYANTINSLVFLVLCVGLRLSRKGTWQRLPVDEYVHITWSNIAEEYAKRLSVKPRPVWVSLSEPSRKRWAEAERGRIRVYLNRYPEASQRDVELMLAHEVAHYTAPPYRGFPVRQVLLCSMLAVSGVMFAACPLWLAIPLLIGLIFLVGLTGLRHGRLVELHCDRVALQLTRDVETAAKWTSGSTKEDNYPEYLLPTPPRHRRRENFINESERLGLDAEPFLVDYVWPGL